MAEKAQASGLQVDEDRAWQEKFWTAQRIGWLLMAAFILVALLGLTGKGGPLSSATLDVGGAVVEYPAITRWQSSEQVKVLLPRSASGDVEVELSRPIVELFSVESIEPEPSQVQATAAGHRFHFVVAPGDGDKLIVFSLRAGRPAWQRTIGVRIGDGPPAQMRLTILP